VRRLRWKQRHELRLRNGRCGEARHRVEGNGMITYPRIAHGTFRGLSEPDVLLTFKFVVL
jgi:hypothetical protein